MIADDAIDSLDANQLRDVVTALRAELVFKQAFIDKLTHENAVLKRLKFAAQSEAFTPEQKSLLDETFDMDLAAVAREIEDAQPKKPDGEKRQPKRAPLPAHLPRHDFHHEPAYMWSWCTTQFHDVRAVVFNFAETRGGHNARDFLQLGTDASWKGSLVVDDFSGYKQCFDMGVTEVGCMAHARRKFHELWANHQSKVGEQALKFFQALYDVERDAADLNADDRRSLRLERAKPIADALKQWLDEHRQKVPDGSATAKALDYSRRRWEALTRYLDDGRLPIDNNWVENQIRPIALGRSNWLFAGSLRAGKRAAAVMSLLHSARINGLDPYAYISDVLVRLPLQPASRIDELLPHRWTAAPASH
ncbi:IS66 family transposase [Pseudomonas syringae]|uniref:IS66 family transposase n=1 Tax=Pseudomonas syringae TaxID=317 RepID=UPI0010106CAF|nr:hypothetical protein B1F71_16245 [Pseudomonas syringae]RXT98554.1 hypothetical protein B1F75_00660 [Pseudomonas syringae]